MNSMKYKGYTGVADVDPDAGVIYGTVIGTRDVITFEADSPKEIKKAFKDSVDDYLDFCKSKGRNPEKPYSGKLVLRMSPQTHRRLEEVAKTQHTSINNVTIEMIERELKMA